MIRNISATTDSLFIFPFFHTGGAEKVHFRISRVALDSGLKPAFIFTGNSSNKVYLEGFKRLGQVIDIGFRYSNKRLNDELMELIIEKVNTSNLKLLFGSNSSFFYRLVDRVENVKIKIDLVHAYNPPYEVSNLAFKQVFKKITHRVFINKPSMLNMQDYYSSDLNGLNSDHFELIYNAPFDGTNEPTVATVKEAGLEFRILFVARNSPEKRPEIAFKIAKRLTEESPGHYKFIMVGDFDIFRNTYASEDVSIISNLNDADQIIEYYKSSHCLILTSQTEGFPLVISEAMFYNVVPLSTNVGGIPNIVESNVNGVLIHSDQKDDVIIDTFCREIRYLNSNRTMYNELSLRTFETAKKFFSFHTFSNSYKKLFSI